MRKNLATALFPETRQAILAVTLLEPERWWFMSDLARHLGVPPSSLQRELASLASAGILVRREEGRHVYYRADLNCPILGELQGILVKTVGLADALKDALAPLADSIDCAFVCGSIARGEVGSQSDVDLMVVGDVGLARLSPVLKDMGGAIGRAINPTVYPAKEFAKKLAAGHHFLTSVMQHEKLYLIGDETNLAEASGRKSRGKAQDEQKRDRRAARRR